MKVKHKTSYKVCHLYLSTYPIEKSECDLNTFMLGNEVDKTMLKPI